MCHPYPIGGNSFSFNPAAHATFRLTIHSFVGIKSSKVRSFPFIKNHSIKTSLPYLDRRVDSLSPGQIGEIANKLCEDLYNKV